MLNHISDTYEIIGKIGAGNSGEIYKAYHKNLGKMVVLKKIRSEIKNIVNIRAEVDVLKHLRHSGLPQVLDFLEVDGEIYTVMDFIEGNSFKQYLDEGRHEEFEEKWIMEWTKQLCATLCYLHGQNPPVIHGDIKPGNVMLASNGNICLIDFNISSGIDGNSAWVTGYTSGYAAPEQIEALKYNQTELDITKWKKTDVRSDIYSLGATVYHIITGVKPQPDEDGYIEEISNYREVNEIFEAIIMKCLEPKPSKRYQNAEELMDALKGMKLKDRRYRGLIRHQKMLYMLAILGTAFFGVIAITGFFKMGMEKQKEYEVLVRAEAMCVSDDNYEMFDVYFERAINLMPNRIDAYYQKAIALDRQRKYGANIDFINTQILSNGEIELEEQLPNLYYLLGNSYEKTTDYPRAAICYEEAIALKPDNRDYYRDYAIALAYSGDIEKARNVLKDAKNKNLSTTDMEYVDGEILYNTEQYAEAKEIFLKCIKNSKDDYIKMRSYIMAAKCMDSMEITVNSTKAKIKLLEKARKKLPKEYNIGVLELLGQSYSDLGKELEKKAYIEKAIGVFNQIQEQGMGSYETDYNLVVLYQEIHEYAQAGELLENMLKKYGEDYRTYKGLAFLEVAKQSQTINEQRNYSAFSSYYTKAVELYQKQLENNSNDMEMQRLEELHKQAVANGWVR